MALSVAQHVRLNDCIACNEDEESSFEEYLSREAEDMSEGELRESFGELYQADLPGIGDDNDNYSAGSSNIVDMTGDVVRCFLRARERKNK